MDSENGAVLWATMRVIFTGAVMRVRSLECRGMDREEFPVFHMGVLYGAQQVLLSRSIPSHEGQQMVAAQHVEGQVALYPSVMLSPPKDELLSSCFFFFFFLAFTFISPPLLNCFKLQIEHVSIVQICILISLVVLTLHTSASILLLICCTCVRTHKKMTLINNWGKKNKNKKTQTFFSYNLLQNYRYLHFWA